MPLLAAGISHHTAPLDIRERLAIGDAVRAERLLELTRREGVEEAVILSTCNRTEIYAAVAEGSEPELTRWLAGIGGLGPQEADEFLYAQIGDEAVRHLFRVACGLDSMVLGEPQIMGQLKQAWQAALDAGGAGRLTDRLFQHAFAISKTVRSETGIGEHPVSVAYIATVLARQIFGELDDKTVLLVGAGEMIELCGRHFREHGIGRLLIANRSPERGARLGSRFDAETMTLEELPVRLHEADVSIFGTAADRPVINVDAVREALPRRRRDPLFMIDLGMPRDIDPAAGELDDVYLYTIDDLRQVADESHSRRRVAADEAAAFIDTAVDEFRRWLNGARAAEGLRQLRRRAAADGDQLAERAIHQIQSGGDPEAAVRQLSRTLSGRILHGPSTRLREAAEQGQDEVLRAADWLFGDDPQPGEDADEISGDGHKGDENP